MPDNFLKRFDKLEHLPCKELIKQGLVISRRFERLEIGDKKIELSITDTVAPEEKAPPQVNYFFYCPYCGKANTVNTKTCSTCNHSLETVLAENFQEQSKLLKRCSCGAMNKSDRKNCWICGKGFAFDPNFTNQAPLKKSDNVITLNIDGREYKSTDHDLPVGVALLMDRIRKEGYSEELINAWMKERGERLDTQNNNLETQLSQVRTDLIVRSVGLVIFVIFIILQFRACTAYLGR